MKSWKRHRCGDTSGSTDPSRKIMNFTFPSFAHQICRPHFREGKHIQRASTERDIERRNRPDATFSGRSNEVKGKSFPLHSTRGPKETEEFAVFVAKIEMEMNTPGEDDDAPQNRRRDKTVHF